MSSRFAVVRIVCSLALIAVGCALCLSGVSAAAQDVNKSRDEIFGGYSVIFPNGYGDYVPSENFHPHLNTITKGFDASNTYYFCKSCNFGFLLDGSGHFSGTITPPDFTGGKNGSDFGYALGGLQYKYHTHRISPFARILVGAANLSPDCCGGTRWHFAAGGGGGLDLAVTPRFSIRLAQVDYIYSAYDKRADLPSPYSTTWNSVRLAAGIVVGLGSCSTPPPPLCTATATPAEVWAGETVNLAATCKGFNPKHPTTYTWTTTGGKVPNNSSPTPTVDTGGMVPGTYTGTVTATDPKLKKGNTATATAPFTVKQPLAPVVSCSANPNSINVGETSTVTMTATDPQGWPMTYGWTADRGQLSSSGGTTATVTATSAEASENGATINVNGTATDARANLSGSCKAVVNVLPVQNKKCQTIQDWGSCDFNKYPKKPWRVDNGCKDTLDNVAQRLQQNPNGKLDVVGYRGDKESGKGQTMGAQRAANAKYYLTTDGPTKVDAGRVQPRDGGTKDQTVHFYFVPEGCLEPGQTEEGVLVDEKVDKGRTSSPWHPEKAPKQ